MEILFIEDQADNWQDAIAKTSKALFQAGFVSKEFGTQCIKRELQYPTGLNTLIPIAIPHTDSIYVHKSAICMMALQNRVSFIDIEDSESEVEVKYVLNLAIYKDQVSVLAKVISLFNDEALLEGLNRNGDQYFREFIEKELRNIVS